MACNFGLAMCRRVSGKSSCRLEPFIEGTGFPTISSVIPPGEGSSRARKNLVVNNA
jgi:hypothetical protein